MSSEPWKSGPRELLSHAAEHMKGETGFDFRIALISIDNAVELGIKTFLGLPKRVRGTEGPKRRDLQDAGTSFPDLLDLLEKYGADRLTDVDLGDVEVYHRLRNTLYHDGNGVTVDAQHVDGYFQVARILLQSLLGLAAEDASLPDPRTSIGDLIVSWGHLEAKLRFQGERHLKKQKTLSGSVVGVVDGLIAKGVLTGDFRRKMEPIRQLRNSIVHGMATPDEHDVSSLLSQLRDLIRQVPDAGC